MSKIAWTLVLTLFSSLTILHLDVYAQTGKRPPTAKKDRKGKAPLTKEEVLKRLEAEAKAYAEGLEAWQAGINKELDKIDQAASRAGNYKLVTAVKDAREAVTKFHRVPNLLSARQQNFFLTQMNNLRQRRMNGLRAAIGNLTKLGEKELATKADKDLEVLVREPVVGPWVHFPGKRGHSMILNMDGSIQVKDNLHAGEWKIQGSVMELRWPASDAPGGFFVDSVRVSQDLTWYEGANQTGTPIHGKRAPE